MRPVKTNGFTEKRPLSERDRVSKAAGVVGFYTLLSRILGLVRDMVVARFFGAGMAADAFFVAFRIPNLLRRLFAEGSLTIAFIPVFTEYLRQKSQRDAFELARSVLTLLAIALASVTVLGILLAPWIVRVQAFGFGGSGPKYELTVLLTRITFPYIFLVSLVAFFMGILNSLRHFAAPAAAPIFLNLGIIAATVIISPYLSEPVIALAVGVLIGGVLQILLQLPWLIQKGVSLSPCWNPGHPAVKKIGLLMLPAIYGSAIYQVNQFIGTLLASFLPQGSVSWLYYADRLMEFPLGVFAIAISTAALPSLSAQAAAKDLVEFRETLSHSVRLTCFITIPAMAGLMSLGQPIIQIFFQRGAFDALSTAMTNKALFCYAVGLWAFSANRVLVSAFYAFQNTRTPVKIATIALFANVGFSLLLMGPLKHAGLALATSLASTIQFFILIFCLKQMPGVFHMRPILISVFKSLAASAVMGLCLHFLFLGWQGPGVESSGSLVFRTGVLIVMGVFGYFALAMLLRCDELGSMKALIRPLLRKLGGK
jgi:putative peptidoglycan lipid II flippase